RSLHQDHPSKTEDDRHGEIRITVWASDQVCYGGAVEYEASMRILAGSLVISPSDLSSFLACRHRAGLDFAVASKALTRPATSNPYAAILQKHGEDHERKHVDALRADGMKCAEARPTDDTASEESFALTTRAMRAGIDVITQARLEADGIAGYA